MPAEKPAEANFYPAGATKAEVEAWIGTLPAAEQAQATRLLHHHPPRRARQRVAVSARALQPRVPGRARRRRPRLLREAAALTTQPTLKRFLETRAAAFLTNDYYASDVAWMELDASIEPTIGPYEVYEDEWFNYKAAFEAFITLRDDAETAQAAEVRRASCRTSRTTCPSTRRCATRSSGALAPIRVVNVVFTAGDANRGVQTAAFNLPNDERVINEKGTKRVMLKNVQEAKFAHGPAADLEGGAGAGRPEERVLRRLLHAHPDARADARARAARHHGRRARRRRCGRS